MNKPSIYFFCPAYNEEENLERFVRGAMKVIAELSNNYLVGVVDDGSTDRTGEIADELAGEYENLKVIHHSENKGYGRTLATGFANPDRAKYDLVGYADSDGQVAIAELKKFLPFLDGNDVIIGWRRNRQETRYRRFQSWVYNKLNRFLFGLNFHDFNCPLKIFNREVIENMEIKDTSFFIDTEILVKAARAGYRIKEVPIEGAPRISGKGSGGRPRLVLQTIKGMIKFLIQQ